MKLFAVKDHSIAYFYFILIIIFFPNFPTINNGDFGAILCTLLSVSVLLFLGLRKVYTIPHSNTVYIIIVYYLFCTIFSLLNDIFRNVAITSDFFELSKPIVFFLIFSLFANSKYPNDLIERHVFDALKYSFIILAGYVILEFLFPNAIRPISTVLYKRATKVVILDKAIGSFWTTYHFAYVMLIPLLYSYIQLLKRTNIRNFSVFLVFLLCLVLTQSRSMYIAACVSFLYTLLLPILYKEKMMLMKVFFVVVILVGTAVYTYLKYAEELRPILNYAIGGLEAMSRGNNNSMNTRVSQIQWAIDNNKYLLIGGGIGKSEIMLESFYSLYYYRYGIIGVIMFLFITGVASIKCYCRSKLYFINNNTWKHISYLTLCVFFAISPVSLLSSCHQDTPKIAIIFYGLLGIIFSSKKDNTIS